MYVYVCMYMYISILYVCIYVCISRLKVYVCVCMCMYVHVYIYVSILYVCMYACMFVCVCILEDIIFMSTSLFVRPWSWEGRIQMLGPVEASSKTKVEVG